MKLILLAAVLVLALTFKVELGERDKALPVNKPVTINRSNLKGFSNYTGSTFGTSQLSTLINFINSASSFFGTDIGKNIQYIKSNMDASFADANSKYNVALELVPTPDFGAATIYCDGGSNFAYIGTGVNLKNPNFTYLVYKLTVQPNNAAWSYISNEYARGKGLTEQQGTSISDAVIGVDGTRACDCSQTSTILTRLQNVITAQWNVICQSSQHIHTLVEINNAMWITFKPKTCDYFIYAV